MESLWMGDGGYGPIAEALFTALPRMTAEVERAWSVKGLGCVKTPKLKFQIESSSRLRQFEKQKR
jgi:hypothetical protein